MKDTALFVSVRRGIAGPTRNLLAHLDANFAAAEPGREIVVHGRRADVRLIFAETDSRPFARCSVMRRRACSSLSVT